MEEGWRVERSCTRPGARAQGPRVWRAEPPGSGRNALWHSKGGHPGHMYTARAPARSQPVAVARPGLFCLPGVGVAGVVRGGQAGGAGALSGRGCVVCAGGAAVYTGGAR